MTKALLMQGLKISFDGKCFFVKKTIFLSLLFCLLPSIVLATPSYRDAYGENVGSGDLVVYVGLLVGAWFIAKLFNTSVEAVACCAFGAFLIFILVMFGATIIQAFFKYPIQIGGLLAFAYWLHTKEKKR